MDIDRWAQLKESIKSRFDVEDEGVEDLIIETQDGLVKQGSADFLIAQTPMGRIKLALEKKPVVLNKTEHYSHRAGQSARVEYEFSDTEHTYKMRAYKWDDMEETWEPIDAEKFQ
jgi:hypothetical protein